MPSYPTFPEYSELAEVLATVPSRVSRQLTTLLRDSFPAMEGPAVRVDAHMDDSSAYGLGNLLADFDRELRRVYSFLSPDPVDVVRVAMPATGERVSPFIQPARLRGELRVVTARDGRSIDLLLIALAELARMMLSDPVQLAVTFHWFWERRPQRWGIHRPESPLTVETVFEQVNESARAAIAEGLPVSYAICFPADGSCDVTFRSLGRDDPRSFLPE